MIIPLLFQSLPTIGAIYARSTLNPILCDTGASYPTTNQVAMVHPKASKNTSFFMRLSSIRRDTKRHVCLNSHLYYSAVQFPLQPNYILRLKVFLISSKMCSFQPDMVHFTSLLDFQGQLVLSLRCRRIRCNHFFVINSSATTALYLATG
jgi:hypothetical protein